MSDVTVLTEKMGRGDATAQEDLFRIVYGELRQLAASRLSRERSNNTLQATALVHEAWLRLGADSQPTWQSQAHFFGAAAEAMRRILIDRARKRNTAKRGGDQAHIQIEQIEIGGVFTDPELLELNDALERFTELEPQKAELVRLRFFVGLQLDETARLLGISEATAKRWWNYARAWLYRELNPDV